MYTHITYLIYYLIFERYRAWDGGGHARLLLPILICWGHKTFVALLVDLVVVVNGHPGCFVCDLFLV